MTIDEIEALGAARAGRQECLVGRHAFVPWLAVYRGGMPENGVSFYTTWCARKGCDHTEQWDCP